MRRVIRKYDDFVKSKSVNEDIETMVTPELAENENEEGHESTEELEGDDSSNLIDSEEDVAPEGYEGGEEEESGEYEGTKRLNKLAEILGASVSNNEIDYEGQKIRFYSEDEKFHIGKDKFETPEEVVEFLQGSEEVVESKRFTRKKRK